MSPPGTTSCARSRRAAWRAAGSPSAARSASPTGRSGRATASICRCGRMSGRTRSTTRRRIARRSRSAPFVQPRIEPEVVFKLKAPVPVAADARAALDCVEWIAPGFEIVQSHFPDWKFAAADCTAAFGLHGALVVGAPLAVTDRNRAELAAALPAFTLTLRRDGAVIDTRSRRQRPRQPGAGARASRRRARGAAAVPSARCRRNRHHRHRHRRLAGGAGGDVDVRLRRARAPGSDADVRLKPLPWPGSATRECLIRPCPGDWPDDRSRVGRPGHPRTRPVNRGGRRATACRNACRTGRRRRGRRSGKRDTCASSRPRDRRAVISAVTMPVGTARMPHPSSIMQDAIRRPRSVFGVMSPKPTVVIVLMPQYIATGMLVKPFSGPSTTYITGPDDRRRSARSR